MIDLTGKVALVTGSSRGIGRAIALRLAEAGADIVINFSQQRPAADEAANRISQLGRRVAEVQADLTEPDDIHTMVNWIGEAFGRLDIVISNSVATEPSSLLEATPAQWDSILQGSARPLVLLTQAARPLLAASAAGRVIAITQSNGRRMSTTAASAVQQAVSQLAEEFAGSSVTINAIEVQAATDQVELGTADAVLLLTSPLSRLINGQALAIHRNDVAAVARG